MSEALNMTEAAKTTAICARSALEACWHEINAHIKSGELPEPAHSYREALILASDIVRKAIDAASAARLRSQGGAPEGWRDISSAPMDGSSVRTFCPIHGETVAAWTRGKWHYSLFAVCFPTHWMPRSAPPGEASPPPPAQGGGKTFTARDVLTFLFAESEWKEDVDGDCEDGVQRVYVNHDVRIRDGLLEELLDMAEIKKVRYDETPLQRLARANDEDQAVSPPASAAQQEAPPRDTVLGSFYAAVEAERSREIEECAKWHDAQAARLRDFAGGLGGGSRWEAFMSRASEHQESARYFRSLNQGGADNG